MKAIIKRELKNYFKNPIYWIGLIIVIIGIYQMLEPYLNLHYFKTEQEIQNIQVSNRSDADIMEGYLPFTPKEQWILGCEKIKKTMIEEMGLPQQEATGYIDKIEGMNLEDASRYLEEVCGYSKAEITLGDLEYHQGSMQEVNGYIQQKLQEHTFSYYFARKFADSCGLYMAFFCTILLSFLLLRDSKKDTYELLHTKPIKNWQYIMGKIIGGLCAVLFILGVLNLVFGLVIQVHGTMSGFSVNSVDILLATCLYILPNMLMIICVFVIVALIFRNPLPAVPLLVLYIIYSNMGSTGADGRFGYYGRPLAIMVRFPGKFFDTTLPPYIFLNQIFLVAASAVLMILAIFIWKRRRVY